MNYFEFYNIPISFKVDKSVVKKIFLLNSKKYHPDFFTLESEERQQEILELSTKNNEAYKLLSDADGRMKYILELKGALNKDDKSSLPQSFLMNMMDLNESLFDLEMDYDDKKYNAAHNSLSVFEKDLESELEIVLEDAANEPFSDEFLKKVKNYYLKRRYLLRIKKNLNKFASL